VSSISERQLQREARGGREATLALSGAELPEAAPRPSLLPQRELQSRRPGTPKLQKAAIEDQIAVHVAAKAAALPARKQDRIAAADNPATELRRARRAVVERKLGRDEIAMPVGKFGVVYCDAPWRFEPYDHDTGGARASDNHYPTMQVDRIKAMTIPSG